MQGMIQVCHALQQDVIQLQNKIENQKLEIVAAKKQAQDKIADQDLEIVAAKKEIENWKTNVQILTTQNLSLINTAKRKEKNKEKQREKLKN